MNKLTENVDYILSPVAIRERCQKIYLHALDGKTHFSIDESQIAPTVDFVMDVIYENYPKLDIPFHSRWGHFNVGSVLRIEEFESQIEKHDAFEQARRKFDLVITSVLLDAGAGAKWEFFEEGKTYRRSEGLAVASYHMFKKGYFSNKRNEDPLRADGQALAQLQEKDTISAFQVNEENPLIGTAGRTTLLNQLGNVLISNQEFFKDARPGNLVDYLHSTFGMEFTATDLLKSVLLGFGDIWPGRIEYDGHQLGDVWSHPLLGEANTFESFVPFHKLSQWLTYSLVEPLLEAGFKVTGADLLTGLAEYRNGGLFLDKKVINLRDPKLIDQSHLPSSELVIEWRALTICLLDQVAKEVQKNLKKSPDEFPLAKVLEGGTWWAGRKVAAQLRKDQSTPIKIDSDGTVF